MTAEDENQSTPFTASAGFTGQATGFETRTAASMAAISIFFIVIIASNARLAAERSGLVYAFVNTIGVICQEMPHLSLHQPHSLS